jgi:hypothetical protein
MAPARTTRIRDGIEALRDATRALRGAGAARRAGSDEADRGAMFDFAALADRLAGYAEDQSEDDWDDFWIIESDVVALRTHVAALQAGTLRGMSPATLPALGALADALTLIAQRSGDDAA